jgi:MarR family transcriptional regulator, lower aerobic nicotinate degradation pathway regulator
MPPLDRVAGTASWLLNRANARAQVLLSELFAAEGVRGYHFRILAALDQYGPSSQADLGRHTGIDESEVVATVKDLLTRRFITIRPDPVDRRRNIVTITISGSRILQRLDSGLAAVQEAVLAPLSAHERRSFLRLLEKLTSPAQPGAP